jgi:hypothetical protein
LFAWFDLHSLYYTAMQATKKKAGLARWVVFTGKIRL